MTENNITSHRRFIELIKKSRKGKLKLYLGMITGVGKTYRMLEETRNLMLVGYNAMVGYADTHGRYELECMLAGLPVIPRKTVEINGEESYEMDLQSILNMRPEIVIIDELAHSNTPGSKNEKRWQDVMDLLDAGINVISAVDIRHIEGFSDDFEKITGLKEKEIVPAKVLRMADEIIHIDTSPDELIERLRDGKIYSQDDIDPEISRLFQHEKLLELKELTMKEILNQPESKIEKDISEIEGKDLPDKFLACVSTHYLNARKIIHKTARLANFYGSEWFILYVKRPHESAERVNTANQRHLVNNLKLATELGGHILQIDSDDIAEAIYNVTAEKQITTILMGLPKDSVLSCIFGRSVLRKLTKRISNTKLDLILVT